MNTLKNPASHGKCATVPVPGAVWMQLKPEEQMGFVLGEIAKFVGSPYYKDFGGFRIVAVFSTSATEVEYEEILVIGTEPKADKPNIIMPPKGLIKPH